MCRSSYDYCRTNEPYAAIASIIISHFDWLFWVTAIFSPRSRSLAFVFSVILLATASHTIPPRTDVFDVFPLLFFLHFSFRSVSLLFLLALFCFRFQRSSCVLPSSHIYLLLNLFACRCAPRVPANAREPKSLVRSLFYGRPLRVCVCLCTRVVDCAFVP